MKTKADLQQMVQPDKLGWHALQHVDGWWVGTKDGVTCYQTMELARAALTIAWRRDGGGASKSLLGHLLAGQHTPRLSAVEAIKRYEAGK